MQTFATNAIVVFRKVWRK